jgi:anti-anti-sigma factor
MSSPAEPTVRKTPLVEMTWNGYALIVKLAGPNVGQREAPIIGTEVDAMVKSCGKAMKFMILDLSDVQFMSSLGLGMCINIRNAAAPLGAKPIIYGLTKDLRALMSMMKIERIFQLVDTREQLNALVRV